VVQMALDEATKANWLSESHSSGTTLSIDELMVYATAVQRSPRQRARRPLARSNAGGLMSKHKGRGMEFDEVRPYQAGDDVRAIDWRVTARTGQPYTKLFREEQERPVLIVTDFSPSLFFGTQLLFKSVQAAHCAAAIAWRAVQRGDKVGGIVGNAEQHR